MTEKFAARIALPCQPLVFVVLMAILLSGCQEKASESPPSVGPAVERHYAADTCRVAFFVDKTTLTVAEQLRLTLRITVPEEVEATIDLPEGWPGDFKLADRQDLLPRMTDDGRLAAEHTFLLSPFLAGGYEIPPMTILFLAAGSGHEARRIVTEAVPVTVASLLGDAADSELDDIAAPAELERTLVDYWPFVAAAVLLSGGILALRSYGCRRRRKTEPPLPPHTQAFQALERLLAAGLLARGEVQVFHDQVSSILRHYIEARFALQAPERTTEEFLADMRATSLLSPGHRQILQEFLTGCDLVKFARYQPAGSEVEHIVALCRRFIQETVPAMNQNKSEKENNIRGAKGE